MSLDLTLMIFDHTEGAERAYADVMGAAGGAPWVHEIAFVEHHRKDRIVVRGTFAGRYVDVDDQGDLIGRRTAEGALTGAVVGAFFGPAGFAAGLVAGGAAGGPERVGPCSPPPRRLHRRPPRRDPREVLGGDPAREPRARRRDGRRLRRRRRPARAASPDAGGGAGSSRPPSPGRPPGRRPVADAPDGEGGIRTLGRGVTPVTRFPVAPVQPLRHLSGCGAG